MRHAVEALIHFAVVVDTELSTTPIGVSIPVSRHGLERRPVKLQVQVVAALGALLRETTVKIAEELTDSLFQRRQREERSRAWIQR